VLFTTMMALLLVHALGFQDIGEDDGYHLTAPNRWLRLGTLSYLRTYLATNASLGFEMLNAIGLSIGGASAAKLLHYAAGLFAFYGIFLSARRVGGAVAGVTAISLLLVATPVCNLPTIFSLSLVDLGSCWMAMTSVVIWLVWRDRPDNRLLVPMALCAGFVGSIKTATLTFGIAWIPVLALELHRRQFSVVQSAAIIVRFGLLELAPVVPWMLRSWRVTGNPLYPMFSSFITNRDWTTQQAEWLGLFFHYYSWGVASGGSHDRRHCGPHLLDQAVGPPNAGAACRHVRVDLYCDAGPDVSLLAAGADDRVPGGLRYRDETVGIESLALRAGVPRDGHGPRRTGADRTENA
jgi:hypothetical protein